MKIREKKAVALIFTLYIVIVLVILSAAFVLRTVHESFMVKKELDLAKSFYIAEGGSQSALDRMDVLINTDLYNTMLSTNPQTVSGDAGKSVKDPAKYPPLNLLVNYAKENGQTVFTLNQAKTEAVYSQTSTSLGEGDYQYDIIVTQKGTPKEIKTGEKWEYPFYYRVESDGSRGQLSNEVVLSGDFTVYIQKDNFAKYALFTDHQTRKDGRAVFFDGHTSFGGPIHTNDQFAFAFNPAGIYDGIVTQQNTKALFYNNGHNIQLDADSNASLDVPTFNDGYTRGVAEIVLSSSIQKQDVYDQATGKQKINSKGIYLPSKSGSLVGGIFVKGDATISMAVNASGQAAYTVNESSTSTTQTITVDTLNKKTTVSQSGKSDTVYNGVPYGLDGVGTIIYVDGAISSLKGKVQKDSEVTIASENNIVISDNIRYEDYNPAVGNPGDAGYVPPNADDKTNLLGIISWGGDVKVSTSAPSDIDVHGIVMARNGVFQVDSYDDQSKGTRGTATLLGGAITQFYGEFGAFDASTGALISGYGRNFVYDERTSKGNAPPYFPSLKTYIGFTDDLTDKIIWQEG